MRLHGRHLLIASVLASSFAAPEATAHTVAVDGAPGEWFAAPAAVDNVGRLARRAGGAGEYVWRDATGDGRAPWPAPWQELAEVRVTGDRTNLYLVARLGGPLDPDAGDVPQLRVAIDSDRFHGSGGSSFGDSTLCGVGARGAYEALLVTRFGSGRAPWLGDAWGGETPSGSRAALAKDGVIEIAVPWSSLGFAFVPGSPVRLSVALFVSGADDLPLDPADGVAGRAADVLAPCTSGPATADELADGALDYSFDLWFDARGECIAPVLVHEVYVGAAPESQWVEVVNATQGVVALTEFKLGDAEQPQSDEGMATFPGGTLLVPGQTFVVARDGSAFFAQYARPADAECVPADAGVRDMLPCGAWGAGPGFALDADGDELLLLDGSNTIVDVVTLGHGAYPGVAAAGVAPAPRSLQRLQTALDTDDCAADFAEQPVPSPGVQMQMTASAGDSGPARTNWAPAWPNPSRGTVSLALRLAVEVDVQVEVLDAGGRRVSRLHEGRASAGELRLRWDATDDGGRAVPPGQYYVRALAAGESRSLRVTVLR